jgi:hypothetical protein
MLETLECKETYIMWFILHVGHVYNYTEKTKMG